MGPMNGINQLQRILHFYMSMLNTFSTQLWWVIFNEKMLNIYIKAEVMESKHRPHIAEEKA